jgi:hypothetical protein
MRDSGTRLEEVGSLVRLVCQGSNFWGTIKKSRYAVKAIVGITVLVKVTRKNLANLSKHVLFYELLYVENFIGLTLLNRVKGLLYLIFLEQNASFH